MSYLLIGRRTKKIKTEHKRDSLYRIASQESPFSDLMSAGADQSRAADAASLTARDRGNKHINYHIYFNEKNN